MVPVSGQVQTARKQLGGRALPSLNPGWAARQTIRIGQTGAFQQFAPCRRADLWIPSERRRPLPAQDAQGSGGASHLGKLALPIPESFAKVRSRFREPGGAESN